MKLKDAIVLKGQIRAFITELQEKRKNIALVTMEDGEKWEDYLLPEERVDLLTKEIDDYMEKYFEITSLIRRANTASPIGTVPEKRGDSISDLIEKSILYRNEAASCKELGNNRPRERVTSYTERGNLVRQATYDISAMAKRARELEQKATILSSRVDQADTGVEVKI